jgi:hypothetical protein
VRGMQPVPCLTLGRRYPIPPSVLVSVPSGELFVTLGRSGKPADQRPGAVVQSVAASSPLFGVIAHGWLLLSVDGKDVSNLDCMAAAGAFNRDAETRARSCLFRPKLPPSWTRRGAASVAVINLFIAWLNYMWFAHLLPRHLLPIVGRRLSAVLTCIWLLPITQGVVDYWRCIFTPPGFTASGDEADAMAAVMAVAQDCESGGRARWGSGGKHDPASVWCEKCNWLKPARSHHCSVCKRCVRRMDHHCLWLDGCVGVDNYHLFLRQEIGMAVAAVVIMLSSLVPVSRLLRQTPQTYIPPDHELPTSVREALAAEAPHVHADGAPWILMFLLMALVSKAMWGCVLLHAKLLAEGSTTIEHLRAEKEQRAKETDAAQAGHATEERNLATGTTNAVLKAFSAKDSRAWLLEVFGAARAHRQARRLCAWAARMPEACWYGLVEAYRRFAWVRSFQAAM